MIKVLIVDDEYIMRQGLRYMIDWEKEGYEIVGEASNGKDAFQLLTELEPHIIISDIVMPLMDGVDFSAAVHHMYPQVQMIILSGYDNFEYVKHTLLNGVVDYILKPTLNPKVLREVLKNAAGRIPGHKLKTTGSMSSYEQVLERYLLGQDRDLDIQKLEEAFKASYFCIYAVSIFQKNDAGQDMSDMLLKKIKRELEGFDNMEKLIITLREERVCILFGYEISQRGSLRIKLEKLNGQLVMMCDKVFGIISRSFTNITEILTVYQQDIARNSDMGFYYRGKNLLIPEKEKKNPVSIVPKFDFSRYNRLLLGKQYEEAGEMLLKYKSDTLLGKMDVYRMKNQMKNMLYIFLDSLQLEDEEKENLRYQFFKEIDDSSYQEVYDICVTEAVSGLIHLAKKDFTQRDDRMDRILSYIEENYREDLKMEDLAERFNFNYHYFSSLFNQQMKEGFNDYLNRVRIGKACELLENPKIQISEVSAMVGYSEHSYFCRVFKKYIGKTPSVWRREENEKQAESNFME